MSRPILRLFPFFAANVNTNGNMYREPEKLIEMLNFILIALYGMTEKQYTLNRCLFFDNSHYAGTTDGCRLCSFWTEPNHDISQA